jgi:hypothetical protein
VINLQVRDCWLWSLIIFLFHRSLFSAVFIPHEDCTPLHAGGLQGGLSPSARSGGLIPPVGGSGGKRGFEAKPLKEKLPCKCIL